MIIKIENTNVYFDEFPTESHGHKIFISHLRWLEEKILPNTREQLVIYTSQNLRSQLLLFNTDFPNRAISTAKIIPLLPYEETLLELDDTTIEVLMCDAPADHTGSVMFLIKKDNKIEHFYTGAFTYYSYFFAYSRIQDLVKLKTSNLYLYLERAQENNLVDEILSFLDFIQKQERINNNILLMVPRFGYENLIAELYEMFPSIISVQGSLAKHLKLLGIIEECEPYRNKKSIVIATSLTEVPAEVLENLAQFKCISINNEMKYAEVDFIEKKCSTLPTLQHYQTLFDIANGAVINTCLPEGLQLTQESNITDDEKAEIYKVGKPLMDYLDEDDSL